MKELYRNLKISEIWVHMICRILWGEKYGSISLLIERKLDISRSDVIGVGGFSNVICNL
jgi:hypothetical protein